MLDWIEPPGAAGGPWICFHVALSKKTGTPSALSVDLRERVMAAVEVVALRYWNDSERLRDVSGRQNYTTHGATEAVDACDALATGLPH